MILLRLRISNAFLIRGDRAILVDSGMPKDGDEILAALTEHGVTGRDLALVLYTHGHSDHCGSARQLRETTAAPIAVHPADAAALAEGRNPTTRPTCLTARLVHGLIDNKFPSVRPDILLLDEMDLDGFGVDAVAIATPGHTAGSTSVLLSTGEAIVGDLLMGGWLGGLFGPGHPGYPYFADDIAQLRASIAKMLKLGATRFYVGHGGPIEAGRVEAWLKRMAG